MFTSMLKFQPDWRKVKLADCELRVRTLAGLKAGGFTTLGELDGLGWERLREIEGFGRLSHKDITDVLALCPGSKEQKWRALRDRRVELRDRILSLEMQLIAAKLEMQELSD